ncbi:hypothetical protein ACFL6C_12485 [Myxococcota bacterium]
MGLGPWPRDDERTEWQQYCLQAPFEIVFGGEKLEYPAGAKVLNDGCEIVYLECSQPARCGQHSRDE